jgi:hypothetical protein
MSVIPEMANIDQIVMSEAKTDEKNIACAKICRV